MSFIKFEILRNYTKPSCKAHIHPYYELYYLIEGNRDYLIGNSIFKISEGTFALIKPNILHKTEGSNYSRILLYFDEEFASKLPEKIFKNCFTKKSIIIPHEKQEDILKLLFAFENINSFSENEANILAQNYMSILITLINHIGDNNYKNKTTNNEDNYPNYIKKTIEYLNNNYMNNISLKELADQVYFSPAHLCRIFKKFTKVNIFEYINTIRLNTSLELLRDTNKNLTEISNLVGFTSLNYFSLQFKKHLNITPLKYRQSLKKNLIYND